MISASPRVSAPLPSPLVYGRALRQQRMYSFGRVQSQARDNRPFFKHCTLTVAADGSEDLLIHCLKPSRPCAAGLDRLKGILRCSSIETGSF